MTTITIDAAAAAVKENQGCGAKMMVMQNAKGTRDLVATMTTAVMRNKIIKKEPTENAKVAGKGRQKEEIEKEKTQTHEKRGKWERESREMRVWKRVVRDLIVGRLVIRDFPCFVLLN